MIDPKLWNEHVFQTGRYAYHATDPANLPDIFRQGLQPLGTRYSQWLKARPGRVYLWAKMTTEHYQLDDMPELMEMTDEKLELVPWVRIDKTQLDPALIGVDEDAVQKILLREAGLSSHELRPVPGTDQQAYLDSGRSLGDWLEDRAHEFDTDEWLQKVLAKMGSFCYRGEIPVQAIAFNSYFADLIQKVDEQRMSSCAWVAAHPRSQLYLHGQAGSLDAWIDGEVPDIQLAAPKKKLPANLRFEVDYINEEHHIQIDAFVDNESVGEIQIVCEVPGDWYIYNIDVKGSYQRRGIATALLCEANKIVPAGVRHDTDKLSAEAALWATSVGSNPQMPEREKFLDGCTGRYFNYESWVGRIICDPRLERAGLQPHEMTPDQFARHPDTLWHGTPSGEIGAGEHNGIHIGTQRAAYEALRANLAGQNADAMNGGEGWHWQPGEPLPERDWGWKTNPQLYPVQVDPERLDQMIDLDEHYPDTQGDMCGSADEAANNRMSTQIKEGCAHEGYYYTNVAEDSGAVSAVVPDRSWLMTHADFVRRALQQGVEVPAHVLGCYPQLQQERPTFSQGLPPTVQPGDVEAERVEI